MQKKCHFHWKLPRPCTVNWVCFDLQVEWSGKLQSGKHVDLYGKGVGKYFHSNAGEKKGMSL